MNRATAATMVCGTLLAFAQASAFAANTVRCEDLLNLTLPDTTITLAQSLPAGANPNPVGMLPTAICRVAGTVQPQIKFEVWLPTDQWNGKFQGVGNGGLAGTISYGAMRTALETGYATASTDTGHVSTDTTWFTNSQQTIDNGHRGIHEMTVKAKAILGAFYGTAPRYSYFNGCSTGGGQGFMEVQRYPEDYDGVLAGAPNWRPTRLRAGGHVWAWVATHLDPASTIPASKLPLLGNAVLAACDALDGVKDGVIEDPRRCNFDPATVLCQAGQDPATCYTAPQVEAVKKLYAGATNPRTGEQIFPGYARGVEFGWNQLIGGVRPFGAGSDFFRFAVFRDPNYDFRLFNFDTDVARADNLFGDIINADSPDLQRFADRGGKMLIYHGWADPLIPTYNSLEYYGGLLDFFGGRRNEHAAHQIVNKFARMFLIPGMGHCSGGAGTDTFDGMAELERWVEKGKAPKRIAAAHLTGGVVDKTRPLCLYPRVAVYRGHGDTNEERSFVCRAPESLHDEEDED